MEILAQDPSSNTRSRVVTGAAAVPSAAAFITSIATALGVVLATALGVAVDVDVAIFDALTMKTMILFSSRHFNTRIKDEDTIGLPISFAR